MRLTKPSFKLKNSDFVVFSASGKYLAQKSSSGSRITLWDVESRSVLNQYKVIKNDSYVGFSPDESIMFTKNHDREIATFETLTGKVISHEKLMERLSTCVPVFLDNDKILDASAGYLIKVGRKDDEGIIIYDKNLNIEKSIPLPRQFVACLTYDKKNHRLFVLTTLWNDEDITSFENKLYQFDLSDLTEKPKLIQPLNNEYTQNSHWYNFENITYDENSNSVILTSDSQIHEKKYIVRHDLNSGKQIFNRLESDNQYFLGFACNDKHIVASVRTNVKEKNMSTEEHLHLMSTTDTEHLYFFNKQTLELVKFLPWEEAGHLAFHPNGLGLAISSYKKSAYVADYRKFDNVLSE